jgi:hypothetical protein
MGRMLTEKTGVASQEERLWGANRFVPLEMIVVAPESYYLARLHIVL